MAAELDHRSFEADATRRATGAGRTLSTTMPRLILEARRVAATVIHGLHGRRRAGTGENFWQFRRFVAWGPGPRASQALMLACRARALIDGRFAPSVDDVLALAPPVLRHRMAVSFAGRAEGVGVAQVIDQMTLPLR